MELTSLHQKDSSLEISITVQKQADFFYDSIRVDWTKSNSIFVYYHTFFEDMYRMDYEGKRSILNKLKIREVTFKKPFEKIIADAFIKRQQLVNVFLENPYLPSSQRFYFHYTTILWECTRFCCSDCSGTNIDDLIAALVFLFVVYVCRIPVIFAFYGTGLLCFVLPIYAVLCLVDLYSGRTESARGSPVERQWLESKMREHPDLDTTVVNASIRTEVESLVQTLKAQYGSVASFEFAEVEKSNKNNKEIRQFLIRVVPTAAAHVGQV